MDAISIILGGGRGTRLEPLTSYRAKPAVPFAGKYRLVDIPISNCINSDILQIYLLTQFNSVSLHQHIHTTYRFDAFHRNFIRILAAQQTADSEVWYQGTADAVRQTLQYFLEGKPEIVLILSGDQLYRMDYRKMIKIHKESKADVTISTMPVSREEAKGFGIMQVDETNRIKRFVEKPKEDSVLDGLRAPMFEKEKYLASMGIYAFNADVLQEVLADKSKSDFGKNIIPDSIENYKVFSYNFNGYWKDIGTIRSFWETNLALTDIVPEFTFYEANASIYTRMRFLPPSKINCCDLNRCLLSEGCIISGHRILHSIIGIRATVGESSVIEHSVIMGSDYYEHKNPQGLPSLGIGRDCYIKNAIIDKNARIGDGAYISPDGKKDGEETSLYKVQDGVIVIPKNTIIPAGTKL